MSIQVVQLASEFNMKKLDEKDYAFAIQETDVHYGQWGLTKREYYAVMALQGLLAGRQNNGFIGAEDFGLHAVGFADILIKELNK